MKGQSTKAGRTTKTQRTRRTEGAGWGKGRRSAGLSAGLGPAPRRGLPATERNRRDRAVPVIFIVAVLCVLCVSVVHFLSRARPTHTAVSEEARQREAVERAPRSWAAHQALGRYYLDHGQPFEAIWELDAAHRLAPGEPTISLQLAVALSSGRLYDQAITQLEELAAQRPPLREGRVQLATLCLGTMRPEKALAALRAAPD